MCYAGRHLTTMIKGNTESTVFEVMQKDLKIKEVGVGTTVLAISKTFKLVIPLKIR